MAVDPAKEAAKKKVADFTESLEKRLKNLDPRDYLPFAASTLRRVLEDQNTWSRNLLISYFTRWRLIVRSIAKAFMLESRHELSTRLWKYIRNSMILPPCTFSIKVGKPTWLHLFFLMLARQQFVVQGKWGNFRIAGGVLIFLQGSFRRTEPLFQRTFGLSFCDWIKFCLLVYLASDQEKKDATIDSRYVLAEQKALPDSAVTAGFRLLSRTVEELRTEYFRVRCEDCPLLY